MGARTAVPRLLLLAATLLASACDGFFHDAAPPQPAELSLTTSFSTAGPLLNPALAAAFDETNRVRVRVTVEETGVLLLDEVQAVDPDDEGIRLQLRIDLPEDRLRVRVEVGLFRNSELLFEGSFVTELVRGQPAGAEVPLVPRPAELEVSGPTLIEVLQQSVQLTAELRMATGDPITDATFTWVALNPAIVSVNPTTGLATALSEGEARVAAVSQGLADTLAMRVAAVVTSVAVTPSEASVAPGGEVAFQATARDAGGSPLSRTVAWSTSNVVVASITPAGVATGGVAGEVQVRAAVGSVVGTAVLRVTPPAPIVTTGATSGVSARSATLLASVNPSGNPTDAWFEFGTSATLATFASTARVGVGSGTQPVSFQQFVGDLEPQTTVYYRAAAENAGGQARGAIRSFTTPALSIPLAPTGLRAEERLNASSSFIGFLLTWIDNSNNEERFELERESVYEETGFLLLDVIPANEVDYLDPDAQQFYEYRYRVRACNAAGCSGFSNIATGYYDGFGGYFRQGVPSSGRSGGR
jgi:hypothetical protein